ncbi:deoxyhypusine synthase [Methanocella conradii HZ254]|uniref:Probable deoxyhypusine synthase 2 n=1 Tax=Methanocella conradii (strain DSM 24694 / JCM 17849 / CGMCC 1.5162 / HZ254) TaxID=1041930 RepID=H8I5P3_METCZ|nr:deoxyhypusine synthase [Methanocella conradii]AFC99362.1 deoxyhypusine synthase [Methanocella conradii HZ254]
MAKSKFLKRPTAPIEVADRSIAELTEAMASTGFQGRKLGESVETWAHMLKEDDLTIFMGLTGAMCPAGMRKIIAYFIQNRMIDCLVSTGANMFHDVHESLGGKHYVGSHAVDDETLFKEGVDRIYDVFAVEEQFRGTDRLIAGFSETLEQERPYSSREFMFLLGKWLHEKGADHDSIVVSAYVHNVPIFVPALCDSSIGIGLMVARRSGNVVNVDQMKDVDEITQIVENSKKTGVIYVGGGVPKNFIQQTEVIASILGLPIQGHSYAIQYTTDAPHWGGLSGCTFEEAVSWGKIAAVAPKVQVFVDATIALPIVSHALAQKAGPYLKKRKAPRYDWAGDRLKMKYALNSKR